jgi:hypothetical protein
MKHTAPTISKEQYEQLAKLAGEKETDFAINRKQQGFGDLLGSFLKEYAAGENTANSDAKFYKLVERTTN